MTQAPATIKVPVAVAQVEVGAGWGNTELGVPGVAPVDGWLAPSRVNGLRLDHVDGELTLAAWGSTRVEQALGRGDWLLVGLGMLVAAILLEPVLRSTALGRPFAAGNARRLLGVAGVVASSARWLRCCRPRRAPWCSLAPGSATRVTWWPPAAWTRSRCWSRRCSR